MIYLVINTAFGMEALLSETDAGAKTCAATTSTLPTAAVTEKELGGRKFFSQKAAEENQYGGLGQKKLDKDYYFCEREKTLASTHLLPQIDKMLKDAGISVGDIDFFACVVGPGSFTGIRIGVSTVRALCYALGRSALPVIFFDVLSYNMTPPFTVAIDAGCGLCYYKIFDESEIANGEMSVAKNADLSNLARGTVVGDSLFDSAVTVVGSDGVLPLKNAVERALSAVGLVSCESLEPLYLRRSQPEREAGEL